MKIHCALCGRTTLKPAVMIGAEPVGERCARRAGLLEPRKGSRVRILGGRSRTPRAKDTTPDMFELDQGGEDV